MRRVKALISGEAISRGKEKAAIAEAMAASS
jgi:hypothetical protein